MLFKPLGRLAGAVLAGALITAVVAAPVATATEEPAETTSTTTPTSSSAPTSSPTEESTSSSAPESSESSQPESSSSEPSSSESTPSESESSENSTSQTAPESESDVETTTGTSEDEQPTPGPVDEYIDDVAYGIDLPNGQGMVLIACAAGEPTGFTSPSFEVIDSHQSATDGRYWIYRVERYDGVSFSEGNVPADWTCGTTGGGSSPVQSVDTENTADEDSQVAYAPTGGIETGFGGLGRS